MKAGQKINMKYLINGAGGTGGVTGYYMKKAGKDVTLIARGEHLKKIQKQGLTLEKMWDKTEENISIPATDMEHYAEHPDVIFVCVKGYAPVLEIIGVVNSHMGNAPVIRQAIRCMILDFFHPGIPNCDTVQILLDKLLPEPVPLGIDPGRKLTVPAAGDLVRYTLKN